MGFNMATRKPRHPCTTEDKLTSHGVLTEKATTYTPSEEEVAGLFRDTECRMLERIAIACRQPISKDIQYELAHAPALAMSDAGALIQGLAPNPYQQNNVTEFLEEFETKIEFFKRCVAVGEMTFPCIPLEFVLWAESHQLELPEGFAKEVLAETQGVIRGSGSRLARDTLSKMLRNQPRQSKSPRVNDKQRMVTQVKSGFEEIERRAKKANIPLNRSTLPGTSKPYIKILRDLSPKLKGRSDGVIKEDLAKMGCRWAQGSRATAADHIVSLF